MLANGANACWGGGSAAEGGGESDAKGRVCCSRCETGLRCRLGRGAGARGARGAAGGGRRFGEITKHNMFLSESGIEPEFPHQYISEPTHD
jgi:hypothetical protein